MQRMTEGMFLTFVYALFSAYIPIKRIGFVYHQFQVAQGATAQVFAFLAQEEENQDQPGAPMLPPFSREIEFDNVAFAYDSAPILRGIHLKVRAGEVVAIVGLSGAGKTTLVNLLPRFHEATSGTVRIDGTDVRKVTLRSLREKTAKSERRERTRSCWRMAARTHGCMSCNSRMRTIFPPQRQSSGRWSGPWEHEPENPALAEDERAGMQIHDGIRAGARPAQRLGAADQPAQRQSPLSGPAPAIARRVRYVRAAYSSGGARTAAARARGRDLALRSGGTGGGAGESSVGGSVLESSG